MSVKRSSPEHTAEAQARTRILGQELRALRKAHGLTLEALAQASGKSVSFLSKIERGLSRPSITALQDIAEVLGVSIGWFFQTEGPSDADERKYVVRSNNRRRLHYSGISTTDYMGFEDYLLSSNLDGKLAFGISYYAPGGTSGDDLYAHQGEEAGVVIEGEMELVLADKTFLLKPGDSFSFPSDIPHTFRNPGAVRAAVVWANTPITLRR